MSVIAESEITQMAEAWFKQAIDEIGKNGILGTYAKQPETATYYTKEDFDTMIAKYFPEPPKAYKVNEVMFTCYKYGLLKAPQSIFITTCVS